MAFLYSVVKFFHPSWVQMTPDTLRKEPWAVSAAFDKDGKLIRSSYGSRRDYMFTKILMKRIEEACLGDQLRK